MALTSYRHSIDPYSPVGRWLNSLFLDGARAQPLPYRPQEQEAETLIGQGADFLNNYITGLVSSPAETAGSQSQDLAMAFPTVRGKMDAAESLKLYRRPDGTTYYVGPGGRELSPVEVDRIMKTGVRGANRGFSGFELAQAYPTHQPVGPAGGLGGPMQMGPQYGPKPLNIDINAVDDRLESIGGSVNIPLGRENILRLGGGFNPAYEQDGLNVGQGYQMYGSFQTPGVGVNATYRRTPQMGNQFGGQINARF